jgi:hypothetical protein
MDENGWAGRVKRNCLPGMDKPAGSLFAENGHFQYFRK